MSADFFFVFPTLVRDGDRITWRRGVFEDKVPCVCLMRGPGTDMFSGHPSPWKSASSLKEQAGCFLLFSRVDAQTKGLETLSLVERCVLYLCFTWE